MRNFKKIKHKKRDLYSLFWFLLRGLYTNIVVDKIIKKMVKKDDESVTKKVYFMRIQLVLHNLYYFLSLT